MHNQNQPASLADALVDYDYAYLMTATSDGAPHAVAVRPRLQNGALVVGDLGKRSRANVSIQPSVGLVWPPKIASDYSLIVDGRARIDAGSLRITPTRAVLHRLAPSQPAAAAGGCAADCIELDCNPARGES